MKNELEKMNKRRELMEDGRRHIIFYTFGDREENKRRDAETERKNEKDNAA